MNQFASSSTRNIPQNKWSLPLFVSIALGFLFSLSLGYAHAQSGAGSIQGTVTDSTGAVISQAAVTVVNRATAVTARTRSNSAGFYQVPGLFTGTYLVTITAPGMKSYVRTIDLLVAQNVVINPSLTPGAVTQQVTVSANAVQLTTTDNGTVNSTLENARINQLPMNGRNLAALNAEVTPGLEGDRANGLMGDALDWVVDGAPLNDRQFGGMNNSTVDAPDPDSIQEVKTETSGSSAAYAEPATAVLSTKSGTNQLHGTMFETARNNGFGIAKGRQNPYNFVAPEYIRNEFGASAGGPIVLPHIYHGKDKSFWFFAYERYSLAQKANDLVRVPTPAMKQGNFSGLVNSSGVLQQLYDPATTAPSMNCNGTGQVNQYCRTPFSNNQIPMNRISPTGKVLYDIMPTPTTTDNPLVTGNLNYLSPTFTVIPKIVFRLDHVFNDSNRAYLSYTQSVQTESNDHNVPVTQQADGIPPIGLESQPVASFTSAAGLTHIFSPSFFSETVLNQQWYASHSLPSAPENIDIEQTLGLPNNFGEPGFPKITGDSILGNEEGGNMFAYGMTQIVSSIDENLTKTIGHHQMQFGGRYRHERFGYQIDQEADIVTLGASATALEQPSTGANYGATPNTGASQGDWFLGSADSYEVWLQPHYSRFHDMEFDAYFQDNYRVSRTFTVNLGLRYEAHPAALLEDGGMAAFDLKNDALVLASTPAQLIAQGLTTQAIITNLQYIGAKFETPSEAGMPSNTLMRNYNLVFSPRAGFAYQPFGGKYGTVVRGAYGRYIYPIAVRNYLQNIPGHYPFAANYSQSYLAANQSPDGLPNYELRAPQQVVMGVNSANVVNSASTTSILPGANLVTINPTLPPDFVTDLNLTVEQPLKGNSVLRASWLWTHGTNLDQQFHYNNHLSVFVWEMRNGIVPPTGGASVIGTPQQNTYAATATQPYDQTTWGNNVLIQKSGWSNDNQLQLNFQRLYHHGFAYQVFYVWSKAFRVGGNTFRDSQILPFADYLGATGNKGVMTSPYGTAVTLNLPPALPAGVAPWAFYHQLNVFENYMIDTGIPEQHIRFNGIVDLPFGHGKRFLGNSNRLVDELVGGFQLAGDGNIFSQNFRVSSNNWGSVNPIHVYKHKAPIVDCRSGNCYKSYEWFNGYIAPTANANIDCTGKCVYGLPSDWQPYQVPVDNTPGTKNYGNNNVQVTAPLLNEGNPVTVGYSGPQGANVYSKTVLPGPINWTADVSLFKVFPITSRTSLRFNLDAFNAFNVQGYNNPNSTDGTEAVQPNGVSSSYNIPRQLQFTLRLIF